jgi:cupin 2 domain-containing protein
VAERFRRGRLRDPGEAPDVGESDDLLLRQGHVEIRQILSGRLDEPAAFLQDEDEWVAVLAGRARLEIEGREVELEAGDWLHLPGGVAHTLLETEPGTSWLAFHFDALGGGR